MAIQVQILKIVFCISQSADIFVKGINPTNRLPLMGK